MLPSAHVISNLLLLWAGGDRTAFDRLIPLVYRELHHIAKRFMRQQGPGQSLQTTAVVHEAYLKLVGKPEHNGQTRSQFFSVAAVAMRHVLIDHARKNQAAKRGGDLRIVPLDDRIAASSELAADILALDDALNTLAKAAPRKAQVVELRYFGGLSIEETATVLKISPETVQRDWRFAKAFLHDEMEHRTNT